AYTVQGEHDKAIEELEAIMTDYPDLAVVYKNLGNVYQSKGEPAKAAEAYQKVIETTPDDSAAQVQLGLAYEAADMPKKAIQTYQAILEEMPNSALTKNQLAWLYADQGEQLDEALRLAQEAVEARPAAGIIDTLGWVHYKREEYEQAVEQFQAALDISPLQPTIRYHLGVTYADQGETALAIQELENALSIDAEFREAAEARQLLEELKNQ
ncbi:tetratricopeptide repeat protein, partial [candidate division KSB3 bacterium]|nr:tetratricopeptide repeat protein [candidate division KSB3 bacterium]